VYSLPNVVLPFFGGVLGDRLGLRFAALLLVTLVVIGSAFVAISPLISSLSDNAIFIGMAIGRTIFGAGAESLNVTQIAMVTYVTDAYLHISIYLLYVYVFIIYMYVCNNNIV
jgi:MFS family permease